MPIVTVAEIPIWRNGDGSCSYLSAAEVDGDGTGPSHGDPDFQGATSLQFNGTSLNADTVPYVVLPPAVILALPGIILGCEAIVTNIRNGRSTLAVVADVGPKFKLGEFSIRCCEKLGIDSSPTHGGTNDFIFAVLLYPGRPAVIDGITYTLQSYLST